MANGSLNGDFLLRLKAADWAKLAAAAGWQPEALASLCSVKLRLLERLFKRQFGKAPHAWMRKLRCRRAAALIAEGWDLKNAGPALGFASAAHLCHEFKKAFGVSPKRFARGVRGGVENHLRAVMTILSNPLVLKCAGKCSRLAGIWNEKHWLGSLAG